MRRVSALPLLSAVLFLVVATLACGPRGMAGLEIRPSPKDIFPMDRKGKTLEFTAGAVDKNGLWVNIIKPTWTTSDPSVVSVDVAGKVTAVGSGKADLIAKFKDFTAKVPLEVRIVDKVEMEPAEPPTLKMGEELQFKATVKNDRGQVMNDAKVTWTMQGYAADVNQTGLVRGQAVGESVLTAQSSHQTARIKIKVLER